MVNLPLEKSPKQTKKLNFKIKVGFKVFWIYCSLVFSLPLLNFLEKNNIEWPDIFIHLNVGAATLILANAMEWREQFRKAINK